MWLKELINYCFCKLQLINYPARILPRENYKLLDLNQLNELEKIAVVRRSVKGTFEESFDKFDLARIDALSVDGRGSGFKRYSMNLLGGEFDERDLIYRQKNKATENWEPGENVLLINYIGDFEKFDTSVPIYFYLKKIHDIRIPYIAMDPNEIEANRKLYAAFNIDLSPEDVKGKTEVRHSPNKLNFWHIELQTFDSLGDPVELTTPREGRQGRKFKISDYLINNILRANSFSSLCKHSLIPQANYNN